MHSFIWTFCFNVFAYDEPKFVRVQIFPGFSAPLLTDYEVPACQSADPTRKNAFEVLLLWKRWNEENVDFSVEI